MTPEPHDDKLKQWLERHPAKTPSGTDPERYTREVMARVERMARPGPRAAGLPAPRLPWQAGLPQWWGAAAALAACAAVAFALVARSPDRLAVAVERDTIILSELGEEEPILPADPAEVAAELQFTERLLLAEAIPVEDDE
ncbi:MAG: hypothetical protein HYY15_01425, partial [Candidatus Omnitrophica bacterium]|nr:hypothetical protein [Candidatus Omnitrophota bacterium]